MAAQQHGSSSHTARVLRPRVLIAAAAAGARVTGVAMGWLLDEMMPLEDVIAQVFPLWKQEGERNSVIASMHNYSRSLRSLDDLRELLVETRGTANRWPSFCAAVHKEVDIFDEFASNKLRRKLCEKIARFPRTPQAAQGVPVAHVSQAKVAEELAREASICNIKARQRQDQIRFLSGVLKNTKNHNGRRGGGKIGKALLFPNSQQALDLLLNKAAFEILEENLKEAQTEGSTVEVVYTDYASWGTVRSQLLVLAQQRINHIPHNPSRKRQGGGGDDGGGSDNDGDGGGGSSEPNPRPPRGKARLSSVARVQDLQDSIEREKSLRQQLAMVTKDVQQQSRNGQHGNAAKAQEKKIEIEAKISAEKRKQQVMKDKEIKAGRDRKRKADSVVQAWAQENLGAQDIINCERDFSVDESTSDWSGVISLEDAFLCAKFRLELQRIVQELL